MPIDPSIKNKDLQGADVGPILKPVVLSYERHEAATRNAQKNLDFQHIRSSKKDGYSDVEWETQRNLFPK